MEPISGLSNVTVSKNQSIEIINGYLEIQAKTDALRDRDAIAD